ncbi:hypothetical protein GCM10023075_50300 [Streptosporangium album]
MRDYRRTLVHLTLNRAGNLDRLKVRFERPRKGSLNQTFEPPLEALKDSHRVPPFLRLARSRPLGGLFLALSHPAVPLRV